jgi:SAM-dependent methyltransferase
MDLSSSTSKNTYIITHAQASEQVRLIQQEQLLTRALGGLLPELAERELEGVEWALDLACGPGEWAQELAFCHRDVEVWGIDISREMIASARMHARTQGLGNAHFEIGDLRQPLRFDDNSFDLVNGRFLACVLDRASWPPLLKECVRILKPGGILRLTEMEGGPSSSTALQRLTGALVQALTREERTFSVDGHSLGMAHMLGKLLRQAGCEQVQQRAFVLDASHESAFHFSACQNAEIFFSLVRPYLLRTGVLDEAGFEMLYQGMLIDMRDSAFQWVSFGLTAWGHVKMGQRV